MRISDWSADVCSSDLIEGAGHRQQQDEGDDEQPGIKMPAPDGAIERKLIDLRHPLSSLEARAQAGGDRAALDRIIDRRSVGDVDRGADIADRPLAREDRKRTRLNSSH